MANKIQDYFVAGRYQIVPNEVLDGFVNAPWLDLQQATTVDQAEGIIAASTLHNLVGVVPSTKFPQGFKLQWTGECPSCYDYTFEHPPPALGQGFADTLPSYETDTVTFVHAGIDDITGEPCNRKVKLTICTVAAVISSENEARFISRYCDTVSNNEHLNYKHLGLDQDDVCTDDMDVYHLVRTKGPKSEALSIIRGILDHHMSKMKAEGTS